MDDYDEPYHFSPACNPDDVILEGSDAEETLEETLAKRARYEAQAERYRNGSIPFIMSATLKGPFDSASGWENPWRHRPRNPPKQSNEDEWWKPGSEDMMFTRKNVLKRAADHGLGWMTPAAALEWCKAAASAEVEAGGGMTGHTGMTSDLDDNVSAGEFSTGNQLSTGASEQPRQAISTQNQLSLIANEPQPCQTISEKGQLVTGGSEQPRQLEMFTDPGPSTIDTGKSKNSFTSFTRGTKRPHDSKWLRGSYISKRGRWDDGPPVPSPTPLPVLRRKDTVSKPVLSAPNPVAPKFASVPSRRSSVQSHTMKTKERRRSDNVKNAGRQVPEHSMQGRIEDKLLSTKSSHVSTQNIHHKGDELEEPQGVFSAISFCYGSATKSDASVMVPTVINLASSSDSELASSKQDIVLVNIHQSRQTDRTPSPIPFKPGSKSPINGASLIENAELSEEVSFVTEVVPSCRDLEKFQFRKKRRIFQQNAATSRLGSSGTKPELKSPAEPRSLAGRSVKFSSPLANLDKDDEEWETTIDRTSQSDNFSQSQPNRANSSRNKSHSSMHHVSPNHLVEFDEDDGDVEWETTIGDRGNPALSSHAVESDDGNEEWETTIGERGPLSSRSVGSVVKIDEGMGCVERESVKELLSISEKSITPPKSQYSNSSWDMVDDIATSSFRRVSLTSPRKSPLRKDHPPEDQERLSSPYLVLPNRRASKTTSPRTMTPKVAFLRQSPRPPSSNNPPNSSSDKIASPTQSRVKSSPPKAPSLNTSKTDELLDQNDISTQSANTTPARSLNAPKSASPHQYVSPECRIVAAEEGASIELEVRDEKPLDNTMIYDRQLSQNDAQPAEDKEDGMSQIQLALSQNCPSTSSQETESSWGHGRRNPDQEERVDIVTMADELVRTQVLDGSSGLTPAKPTLVAIKEGGIPSRPSRRHVGTLTSTTSNIAVVGVKPSPVKPSTPLESWRASQPQTPWADDTVLPPTIPAVLTDTTKAQAASMYNEVDEPGETEWEQFERSLLAQNDKITPLKAFITPLRLSKLEKAEASKFGNVEEDTTINPWTSSLKKTGSKKTKKRVSFGFALAEEENESFRPILEQSPERDPYSQTDVDPIDDGHPPPRPISILGNSSGIQRRFKRILPDKTASQLNSSPAPVEAMAEAFVIADQEAPMKRTQSSPVQSRTQSPQMRRSSWGDDTNDIVGLPVDMGSLQIPASDLMKDFDIAEALGEANAFLEDWSVEADLNKARELEQKGHESNAMKRRKLFGIV